MERALDEDRYHPSHEAAAQLLSTRAVTVENGQFGRRTSSIKRLREHGKRLFNVVALLFVVVGMYVAGSAVYSTTDDDHHAPKSRGKREWSAPAYPVIPITDPHERRMLLEDINEKRALTTRHLVYRRDWTKPTAEPFANLPRWFNQMLFRKGEALGVSGLTRLMPAENCDMVVVKRYDSKSMPLSKDQLPSTRFQHTFSPMFPLYLGVDVDEYGRTHEAMQFVGPSLYDLMRDGIVWKGMSVAEFDWFLRVIYVTHRNIHGLAMDVHDCLDPRSILVGLTNWLQRKWDPTSAKSLSMYDSIVLGRLQCVTIHPAKRRNDAKPRPLSAYESPEMFSPDAARTIKRTLFQMSQTMLDGVGGKADDEKQTIELPLGALPDGRDADEYIAVISHLRWGDLLSAALPRFFEIFRHIKPGTDKYADEVYISPTFASQLSPISVASVFAEPDGTLKMELRYFYPALFPFATIECHLHGEAPGKLCTVTKFLAKLRGRYKDAIKAHEGQEIRCPLKPGAGPDRPYTAGEEREPYAYPDLFNYERCMKMLNKVDKDADVTFAHRIVSIKVLWCTLSDGRTGMKRVIFIDNDKKFKHNYEVQCCTYDASTADEGHKCEPTPGRTARPWDADLRDTFFAVDDILIRSAKLTDPEVQRDAPLLKVNDQSASFSPEAFPAEYRARLYQQRACIQASKDVNPKARRTTPKKSIVHQQYVNGDKHLFVFHNIRWDNVKDEDGNRLDRCETVHDAEDALRFCKEREDYECVVLDGDMTAEEWMEVMWDIAKNFAYRSLTYILATHGNNNEERGRHYVFFPEKDRRGAKTVDVDEFFDVYFRSPQFFGKNTYVLLGACRGDGCDVLSTRSVDRSIVSTCSRFSGQSSRASEQIRTQETQDDSVRPDEPCVVYIPDEVMNARPSPQETFLAYLQDNAETRRLIVKAPSDSCAGLRDERGSYFLQHYFEVANLYPELPVTELWHRAQARITYKFQLAKSNDAEREDVQRQTTTITLDRLGTPSFLHPAPSRTVTDDQLYPAGRRPFYWSNNYCLEKSEALFKRKGPTNSVAQRLLDEEYAEDKKKYPNARRRYT